MTGSRRDTNVYQMQLMTLKFQSKLSGMCIRIKDLLLPGGKVELKFSTLSGYNIYPSFINITTSEHNPEAALCLQELTSALPSQRLSQAHLLGSTSPDYQSLPQFLLVCKSF